MSIKRNKNRLCVSVKRKKNSPFVYRKIKKNCLFVFVKRKKNCLCLSVKRKKQIGKCRVIDFSINGLCTANHLRSQRIPTPFKIKVKNYKMLDLVIRIELTRAILKLSYYYFLESAVQGRERGRTLYQSKDPNPTQPTHGRKKMIK